MNKEKNKKGRIGSKIVVALGLLLCAILLPLLVINCTLLVKGALNKDEAPDFLGFIPLTVMTESMEPEIYGGDLILSRKVSAQEIEEGNIISFFDPLGDGTSIVTHKVKTVFKDEDGNVTGFETYGINNVNADGSYEMDELNVPAENLVGAYTGVRFAFVGHVVMFLQTTTGLLVCLFALAAIALSAELYGQVKKNRAKQREVSELEEALETLKGSQGKMDDTKEKR